jgi:hypothetical protein
MFDKVGETMDVSCGIVRAWVRGLVPHHLTEGRYEEWPLISGR